MENPTLSRYRSSTAPSKQGHGTLQTSATEPASAVVPKSIPSAIDPNPRSAQTLPVPTSDSRVHIPHTSALHRHGHGYRHKHAQRHSSKHHHTQSDVQGVGSRSHRHGRSEGLPHLTSGIAAERERRAEQRKLASDLSGSRTDDLWRIASNQSHRAGTGTETVIEEAGSRYRAISDPKKRRQQTQRSQVEILLDLADAQKMADRTAASQADVDRIRKANDEAEQELKRRLAAVNKTSADITRRLDYTYYNVLEKMGNLEAIVQSFRSLSSQIRDLIDNFTREASTLEMDVVTKVETFRTSFDEREVRVKQLEERGARANSKAQELRARFENARQRVDAWEKKEGAERRRRSWFWRSFRTAFIVVLVAIFSGFTWREWNSEVDVLRKALLDDNGRLGRLNQSLFLDKDAVGRMDVPGDVKSILSGAAERRSRPAPKALSSEVTAAAVNRPMDDERLRALDEL